MFVIQRFPVVIIGFRKKFGENSYDMIRIAISRTGSYSCSTCLFLFVFNIILDVFFISDCFRTIHTLCFRSTICIV